MERGGRRTDTATVYLAAGRPAVRCLAESMARLFESLDAFPRKVAVRFRAEKGGPQTRIGYEKGEPVFSAGGEKTVKARFRGRWIAEHPVPLTVGDGCSLVFVPSGPRRVRVRRPSLAERIFRWR